MYPLKVASYNDIWSEIQKTPQKNKHTYNLLCEIIFKLSICRFKIKIWLKLQGCGRGIFHKKLASASVSGSTIACATEIDTTH